MRFRGDRTAPGAPGIDPRWSHGDKVGVGTSYSADSKVWFTLWRGILTECYYPTIDRPQLRDFEFLVADGAGLFHEERRHLEIEVRPLASTALGYHVVGRDPDGRYSIEKEILTAPHLPVVLQHVQFHRSERGDPLRLYLLAAPHLDGGGAGNNGFVVQMPGRELLAAEHNGIWLAIGASVPFEHLSAGYVGRSDLWTDLEAHHRMTWEYDVAPAGNVALGAELDLPASGTFTVALAFGHGLPHAVAALLPALATPFDALRQRFLEQWARAAKKGPSLVRRGGDRGALYRTSTSLLLAHEDKTFPGAFIASTAIPWGNSKGDEDRGGYHLVWTRDLCEIAGGLQASGHIESALRTLVYLATTQQPDGGFAQNFWLNGDPYWSGMQLDEVALPILLADRLDRAGALEQFDPYPAVLAAARFLIEQGPATGQERWEETSGFSPSTLAAHIAALIAAARFTRERGAASTARFLEEYADFLEQNLERWTVTRCGTLLPGVTTHYVRILPADPLDPHAPEDLDAATLLLTNQPPGMGPVPAASVVDCGVLELVRYGIRRADDPIILSTLEVIDATLKVETPAGPVWRRYNGDGYGEKPDGTAYAGWGKGRGWPLLTGERGTYELAAGRDATPYLRTLERLSAPAGLLSEQVWDEPDLPRLHLVRGGPTGSARPLLWAHAEYVKLLRSAHDHQPFDRVPEVYERYAATSHRVRLLDGVWKRNRQPQRISRGGRLRIIGPERFRLHWSMNDWATSEDTESNATGLGLEFLDLDIPAKAAGPLVFTFFWSARGTWEGQDYRVQLAEPAA
ncbi:MAG: glycoside hydrolase family 15 protein [Thermoplasmata archaeon]|nr:glycoside hydrolase family 15 protein [Thermoplasmata archaeon]